jgi:outer membrane protein OmpA-like peptidoglycan-associated protein
MRSLLILFTAVGISSLSSAQNLVPNFSFEEYSSCPGNFSEAMHEFRANDWRSASMGTPDHFHSCSEGEADVPHNWAGVSEAYEGKGYAGLYLWMNNGLEYREYLQCKLLQPLLKDSMYTVGFHYKMSSYSKYAIDRIGLLLTDSLVSIRSDKVLSVKPTLSVVKDSALTETTGLWEKAHMDYKATGNETHLLIGNFFDNQTTRYYEVKFRPLSQPMLAYSAYYYIDDVRVIPQYMEKELISPLIPEFALPNVTLNTTYILKNIQFELDSYKLTASSFDELDQIVAYMRKNPKARVQLFGHTDDQGGEKYNLKLSDNRAKSAAGYLVKVGIAQDRIETFGYGKSKPLMDDTSPEARAINRRVELRFIR